MSVFESAVPLAGVLAAVVVLVCSGAVSFAVEVLAGVAVAVEELGCAVPRLDSVSAAPSPPHRPTTRLSSAVHASSKERQ